MTALLARTGRGSVERPVGARRARAAVAAAARGHAKQERCGGDRRQKTSWLHLIPPEGSGTAGGWGRRMLDTRAARGHPLAPEGPCLSPVKTFVSKDGVTDPRR